MADLQGLPSELRAAYATSTITSPKAGDVWVLSLNNKYVGTAMLAAVYDDFVLAWPITPPGEPSYPPAYQVECQGIPGRLSLWPTMETGVGLHLLDTCVGHLYDQDRIQQIIEALGSGEDPGLAPAPGVLGEPGHSSEHRARVDHWSELCFDEWPDPSLRYLAHEKLSEASLSSRDAARVLDLTPPEVRQLWQGIVPVNDAQLRVLAQLGNVAAEQLVGYDSLDEVVQALAHPEWKSHIKEAVVTTGLAEADVRSRSRSEYALAAREDSLVFSPRQLRDAIARVAKSRNLDA